MKIDHVVGSIENRSRSVMKQEGKAHVYIKSNQIETKGYNSTQTDVLTSFEKEGSSGGQMPRLEIEAFEPRNQRVRGRVSQHKG